MPGFLGGASLFVLSTVAPAAFGQNQAPGRNGSSSPQAPCRTCGSCGSNNRQEARHGWVRIAYGVQTDGTFEGFADVRWEDLQRVLAESHPPQQCRERATGGQGIQGQNPGTQGQNAGSRNQGNRRVRVCKCSEVEEAPGGQVTVGPGNQAGAPQQEAAGGQQTQKINGTVVDTWVMPSANGSERIAEIRLPEGGLLRVDLGPANRLDVAGVKLGDQLTISGRPGEIDGSPIFTATSVRMSEAVMPPVEEPEWRSRRFYGVVQKTETVTVQGQPHLLARLRTEQGAIQVVDLGPKVNLWSVTIAPGDFISMSAVPGEINQRSALLAVQFRVNDRSVQVNPSAFTGLVRPE
jgi:hypothetical protein